MASGAMASSWARNSELLRIFSGCMTGRPAARAACLTAGAVSCWPRPTGRSGCETASAISWPAASSASRVGTAKLGVPQKTSFTGILAGLPLAFALHLADLAQVDVALEGAHAEDEQHAVEVVDLMLDAAREQLSAVHLEPLAALVLGADADFGGADHFLADIGEAEAAFVLVLFALLEDDLGIDEHQAVFGDLAHAEIDDRDAPGDVHLRSGQADALGGVGGLEHVRDQLAQLGVELGDRVTGLGQ